MKPLAFFLCLLIPHLAFAHEGHDHGDGPTPRPAAAHPRFEAVSPDLEMVGELHGDTLELFLDRYADNQPVSNASLEIESEGHRATAQPQPDGSYSAKAPWLSHPGKHELVITVRGENLDDLLIATLEIPAEAEARPGPAVPLWLAAGAALLAALAGALHFLLRRRRAAPLLFLLALLGHEPPAGAHEGHDHGENMPLPASAGEQPTRLADGSVFVPKAAQRLWKLRTSVAGFAEHPANIELIGHVIADPAHSGRVQSSQTGRIEPGVGGIPHLGQRVARGEILAWLAPAANSLERGGSQAQLADIAAQSELAEKRLARLSQLEGVVAQRDLDAARAEARSLAERKAALDAALQRREALRAPAAGVVSAVNASIGQVVEARETLFEIVNPDKLWVEAISYDPALPAQVAVASAAESGAQPFSLAYLGSGRQMRDHALPMQFRVQPPLPSLHIGQPVRVFVETKQRLKAVAVPQSALSKNIGGDMLVWLHISAERFVPRKVRTQPLDASRVAILEGVRDGERVVTQGALLLNQVH
jgi:RND family efflux transporter MFP subunit